MTANELEEYEFALLRRPADPAPYDDARLEEIQRAHVEYLAELRRRGLVVTNGPFIDQPDENLRGFVIYCTGSLDAARRLADADPVIRAGRMVADLMRWWCPAGTMTRPGTPVGEPG